MKVSQVVELPEREVSFVRFVCEGYAPARAATMAGYSIATAPGLMRKPRVVAAILACATNATAALEKVERRKPYGKEREEAVA